MSRLPLGKYEMFTYTHIPTGEMGQTLHTLSAELLYQRQVFFYGRPMYEWELVKTDVIDFIKDKTLISDLLHADAFEVR